MSVAGRLLDAARRLRDDCDRIRFAAPVTHVYNPLAYAFAPYEQYVRRYGDSHKHAVLLGMNPGPFGMMQTGVPFGEVAAVRDWMQIDAPVLPPAAQHPKRQIAGFACTRSEVSGKRLWGWAAHRFGDAASFFERNFVLNYCPLVFLEESGRNYTPDKLPAQTARLLAAACDRHLLACLDALQPHWAIGVGGYAAKRLELVLAAEPGTLRDHARVLQILHPSPASPVANRGWQQAVDATIESHGVYR